MAKHTGRKRTGSTKKRSGAKPKPAHQRKQRTKPSAPGAGDNSLAALSADEQRALFLQHRGKWVQHQAKQAVLDAALDELKADLKNDGFSVKQMKIADDLAAGVKREERVKAEVADRLKVAWWIGHPMGAQLDLFSQPDRTPSVERAFEEGKTAGMEGRVRKPPYSPELPQHEKWMQGWYDGQEILAKGFNKPAPKSDAPPLTGDRMPSPDDPTNESEATTTTH